MDLGTAASAVLKVGSLSGLAALGWQLWRAWDERRWRLAAETRRNGEHSMDVVVSYRPKSQHLGLEVRAQVLHPKGARAAGVDRPLARDTVRSSIERAVQQLTAGPSTGIRLEHREEDPEGVFRGVVYVTGMPEDTVAATLKLEVWTTGYPRRIARRTFKLSPID